MVIVDAPSDEDSAQESKPRPKRARTSGSPAKAKANKPTSNVKTVKGKNRSGKLAMLPEMPIDILHEVRSSLSAGERC